MLKIKVIERYKPSNKDLELFNSIKLNYTYTNWYGQIIEKTNIKQVFPIVYKINDLVIYEFPKKYVKKQLYIVNNKISYNYNELKEYLFNY